VRIRERSTRGVILELNLEEYQTVNDALRTAINAAQDELYEHLRYDERHRNNDDITDVTTLLTRMRRLWESW